ncbi:hypothetical protein YQE_10038, partial [Dendroctonus ponderosae]
MDATCQHVSCRNYCQNGATCMVKSDLPTCECTADYTGTTCTTLRDPQILTTAEQDGAHKGGSTWEIIAWAAAVVLIVAGLALGLIGFEAVFKRRPVFSHERLQENDFTNPMYQDRDAEPFTLDADKSGNFANPVYESMYNGSTSGREEKAVLLEHPSAETPPLPLEEL